MNLPTAPYVEQNLRWPAEGQHVLAHYDATSVVVYQAYRPAIGRFAIEHGYLGGPDFSFSRMSWIKPNFMWMMYRSGWGTKEGQEVTLGLRLRRTFFDEVMAAAVPSTYDANAYANTDDWQLAVTKSDVRRQWDPDHSPTGAKLERRAVQLGLRGRTLERFAEEEMLEVIDMSGFVAGQRAHAFEGDARLQVPVERIYLLPHLHG